MASSSRLPHVAIFPFMAKGHAMPLLHLAHLLHRRRLAATVTFFTTSRNAPFLRANLAGTDTAVVELPFPSDVPLGVPAGVESTDELPSMSLFLPFVSTVSTLRPAFTAALSRLEPRPDVLVVDGFLAWTQAVADELGVPRLVSYGFGGFPLCVSRVVTAHKPHAHVSSLSEPFPVHGFPGLQLSKADLNTPFDEPDPTGPLWDFVVETARAADASRGIILNSFHELEAVYLDRWNQEFGPKVWPIGPLCLAREPVRTMDQTVLDWLDSRLAMNRPVLYVAFGSQAEVSRIQLEELAVGLDRSGLDFLWVVRSQWFELEDRVGDRGKVVHGWVDQLGVLRHECIKGFFSHCGWNSVIEGLSMGVPILALPMAAEQRINAKFVVDELRIGLRVWPNDGTRDGIVTGEDVGRMVRELILGEEGKHVASRSRELAVSARRAMDVGGSSYVSLETMIHQVCGMGRAESNGKASCLKAGDI